MLRENSWDFSATGLVSWPREVIPKTILSNRNMIYWWSKNYWIVHWSKRFFLAILSITPGVYHWGNTTSFTSLRKILLLLETPPCIIYRKNPTFLLQTTYFSIDSQKWWGNISANLNFSSFYIIYDYDFLLFYCFSIT